MQANYSVMPDGTLNGAMNKADADRAMALLKTGMYSKVDASHVINLDNPDLFVEALNGFFLGKR
jgi:hypothetical protein